MSARTPPLPMEASVPSPGEGATPKAKEECNDPPSNQQPTGQEMLREALGTKRGLRRFGLEFADAQLKAEYSIHKRSSVLQNLWVVELVIWPVFFVLLGLWLRTQDREGLVFRLNNVISIVWVSVHRRVLKYRGQWCQYNISSYMFILHYLLYQSLSRPRVCSLLSGLDSELRNDPYPDEAYALLWCMCGIVGYVFFAQGGTITCLLVCLSAPVVWIVQVLALGTTLSWARVASLLMAYLAVNVLVYLGGRQMEVANCISFLQNRALSRELRTMHACHEGLQKILAMNFDASDAIGLDMTINQTSKLRALLGQRIRDDCPFYSLGYSPIEKHRLKAFFTRLQNLIMEDPGVFHGPDRITAAIAVEGLPIDVEVETIWMPRGCTDKDHLASQPPGLLWVGLRRARAPDAGGELGVEEDIVDLAHHSFLDDSSQTLGQHGGSSEASASAPASLPTTTRTGNVFVEVHKLKYSEEDCKAEMQEKLKDVIGIGAAEGWLFGTEDLELVPERVLGVGGYGVVVAAKLHGADVAVKLPKFAATSSSVRHLISMANELRIVRKVRHPSVVMFHGACIDASICELCLVSELVQGTQMDRFICPPPMPPGETGRHKLIYDVCCALRYLHAQDPPIIHGDLKPANVMVERLVTGIRAKILDFGLARVQTKHAAPLGGTLQWKAPEVIRNSAESTPAPSADVFSFGLLAYFSVTGLKPFPGLSHSTIKHLRKRGQNMPRVWPEAVALLEECRALCSECLVPAAERRPTMQQVNVMLGQWRPLPGSGENRPSSKPCWHDQVQYLRQLLNGQPPPSPFEGGANTPSASGSPKQRMLHQACKPTPAASKRLSLTSILVQWNVPLPEDSCCGFHALLHEALVVLQELQMERCGGIANDSLADDCPHFQCQRCGLLDTLEGTAECGICRWMMTVDPQHANEDEPTHGQPLRDVAKLSL